MTKGGKGDVLQRLSPTQNLGLGMMSGVMAKLCNYPLLSWKNSSQQSLPISFNPKVVYRGLPVACLNLGGVTAVQFWFTGFFQKLLSPGDQPITPMNQMAAAFLGGVCSGIPCSVWELTMIQQQRFGGSLMDVCKRVTSENGVAGLGRGMSVTVGRESLFTMAMLGVTPSIQRKLMEDFNMDPSISLAGGALSGALFSAVVTHPMDTIKTCMQGDIGRVKYTSVVGTGKNLVGEFGLAGGLFKGLQWRFTLICTTFFLVNKFKASIAPVAFPELTNDPNSRKSN